MSPGPPPDHAGDLVSAFVDGELDEPTAAWVQAHLAECADCAGQADAITATRRWIRELPPVEASTVVGSFLARHRSMVRVGAAFVVASTVAVVALAVTASVLRPTILPEIDELVATHESAVSAATRGGRPGGSPPDGMRPVDRVDEPYSAPAAMLGNQASLSRRALFGGGGLTVVVYGDGESTVSAFEQHGRLDWDALPEGLVTSVGERRAWFRPGEPTVAVTEVGHLVVTVVSLDRAAALTVIDGLPPVRRGSTFHRVHDACQRVTSVFALSG